MQEFDRRYNNLNAAQRQAVDTIDGPVMVIAGPGTGKTELLSVRVANILKKTDTLPENILCLTFTEAGASAMRERLVGIIGKDAYKVAIHTFHSFGSEIMNSNREYFYNGALFQPADELKQYEILKSIFDDLEYSNPLASTMNGEYSHMGDAKMVISELKRSGGMTSDELLAVINHDEESLDKLDKILLPALSDRVSKNTLPKLEAALKELLPLSESTANLYEVTPLITVCTRLLEITVNEAREQNSTKPITAFKSDWVGKNYEKQPIFKNRQRLEKLKALSFVYYEYIRRMEQASLYDYDDMILQVVHAMEVYPDLRYGLQEKYLYLMVDEFQDTNIAQMRILHSLTDNAVNEGNPNILAVGDDDQAIYGFQGADVSNMLRMKNQYPSMKHIVLTDNYRSGEEILKTSRKVIIQGSDRLEDSMPEINKALISKRKVNGEVSLVTTESPLHELKWVTDEVTKIVSNGGKQSVAVLARNHKDLINILPYLHKAEIPVRYEKQNSALEQPVIIALELLSRAIIALAKSNHDQLNALLPELLSHPAWGVKPADLWRLSLNAYENRQHWMSVMETTPAFEPIHNMLVEYASLFHTTPLEPMLDILIGHTLHKRSPIYNYFFSDDALATDPHAYLDALHALQAIRGKVRDFSNEAQLNLETFIECLATYRKLKLNIQTVRQSRSETDNAVQLLTAHGAKGLEFDHVFILHGTDSKWGQSARHRSRFISYPENLPLAPAGDTADERLRLFYVAMTRAKNSLTITHYETDEKSKKSFIADFLINAKIKEKVANSQTPEEQVSTLSTSWYEPLTIINATLRDILQPRLDTYRLSATALTSFLDVTRGGPRKFLLDSLLSFPHASSLPIAYGNAVHRALQQAHTHFLQKGEPKPLEDTLHDFELALKFERLNKEDFATGLERGGVELPIFLKSPEISFTKSQKAEVPFAHQQVQIGDARLTGKIDLLDIDTSAKTVIVTDYKTSKPPLDWKGSDDLERQKIHRYKQQLLFYVLLLQGSRDYHGYEVKLGQLAFARPTKSGKISVLSTEFEPEEIERTKTLIEAAWRHIVTLDMPDTSNYPETLAGILAFEQDLIDGKI